MALFGTFCDARGQGRAAEGGELCIGLARSASKMLFNNEYYFLDFFFFLNNSAIIVNNTVKKCGIYNYLL